MLGLVETCGDGAFRVVMSRFYDNRVHLCFGVANFAFYG